MRTKQQIEEELQPTNYGTMTSYPCGIADRIQIELLLDIREILQSKKEITGTTGTYGADVPLKINVEV